MIRKEFYRTRNDGVNLYKTYSDENLKIKQIETDIIYDKAIDIKNAPYTYEETNEPIEEEEKTEIELKAEAYDIITGKVDYE